MESIPNKISAPVQSCRTVINVYRGRKKWSIENFVACPCTSLKSSTFTATNEQNELTHWKLELYPNHNGNVLIYLHNLSKDSRSGYHVLFTVSVVSEKGSLTYRIEKADDLSNGSYTNGHKLIEVKELLSEKKSLLPNGTLTVHCDLIVSHEDHVLQAVNVKDLDNFIQPNAEVQSTMMKKLSSDLTHLYISKQNTDVKFIVGHETFQAHIIILSARSKRFSDMLDQEKKMDDVLTIHIENITADIFEALIFHIYSGQIKDDNWPLEKILALFSAAQEYGLVDLSMDCSNKIVKFSNGENFWDCFCKILVWDVSDTLPSISHCELIEAAKSRFQQDYANILKTPEWGYIKDAKPQLAIEIFQGISK